MRHRIAGRRLSRTGEHRLAMRRNMAASLFQHETISTTIEKAKEIRPFVEKLITLAKQGDLAARRRAISMLGDREMVEEQENGDIVSKGTVIGKLFSELGPRYLDRPGGYTRIIRLSLRRLGDNGQLVLLQLIGPDEEPKKKKKGAGSKRSRRMAATADEATKTEETAEVAEAEEVVEEEEARKSEAPDQAAADQEAAEQEKETPKSDEDQENAEGEKEKSD